MSQRLVLIPWEEYQTLIGKEQKKLVGRGKPVKATPEKGVEVEVKGVTLPPRRGKLPQPDKGAEEKVKGVTLPDTTPPGLLASKWLTWK